MTSALDEIIRSPRFPGYVEDLQRLLTEERQRRERFYEEIDEDVTAEFINGEVIVQSPATYEHVSTTKFLLLLLHAHVESRQLGFVGSEKLLVTFPRNDYEPDVCFWRAAKSAAFQRGQLKFPPPDFIAEVLSPTTERIDRGVKFEDYAANGVAEYWLVDPKLEQVQQHFLREGRFELRATLGSGNIRSVVIEGFDVPVRALFDSQVNLRVLGQLAQPRV
ncbi:MAG: Uma2 family endonuclease [Verrucomicrobiales bacterium]|nr:Uma2 family endonuclease [Verrucomicrobiales bacterium]